MVTDPVSDMIVSIKNAGRAKLPAVQIPYSDFKNEIAQILSKEGYVGKITKKGKKIKKVLEIDLVYKDNSPRITNIKRISKPSKRVYKGTAELKKTEREQGVIIVSTPKGVLTSTAALKEGIGGEALFLIW